jgi:hypothetical protein
MDTSSKLSCCAQEEGRLGGRELNPSYNPTRKEQNLLKMIIYVLGKQSSGACLKIQVPQEDMGVIEHTPRRIFTMRAIGLLAPSQRYSTIEGEEACQL